MCFLNACVFICYRVVKHARKRVLIGSSSVSDPIENDRKEHSDSEKNCLDGPRNGKEKTLENLQSHKSAENVNAGELKADKKLDTKVSKNSFDDSEVQKDMSKEGKIETDKENNDVINEEEEPAISRDCLEALQREGVKLNEEIKSSTEEIKVRIFGYPHNMSFI